MPALIEPAAFVYQGEHGQFTPASFTDYVATMKMVDAFCLINDRRLMVTKLHIEAMQENFPFATVRGPNEDEWGPFGATQAVVRILERLAAPLSEFAGVDEEWAHAPSLQRVDVYLNADLWLSWTDAIGQAADYHVVRGGQVDMLASSPERSCLGVATAVLTRTRDGETASLVALRLAAPATWPSQFIDPGPHAKLMLKRPAGSPPVVWEKSGHQPPAELKKLVIRTAADSGVVVRAGSSYFSPDMSETCKLSLSSDPTEIFYCVSDGRQCVKGFFATTAVNAAEQLVCLALLRRQFTQRCREARLPLPAR